MKKDKSAMAGFLLFALIVVCMSTISIEATLPLNVQLPDDPFWNEDAQEANNNENHFIEPDDSLNYADYHWVNAHNAYTYHRFFETVRQQDQTILGLLTYGVRGLKVSTYNFNLSRPARIRGPEGAKIALSHGTPGPIAFSQKAHQSYQSLQYELRRVIEFMRNNPQAVITIVLENYGDLSQTAKEIQAVTEAADYDPILKPHDWPYASGVDPQWPTLGWMRENNKRLIIFTQFGYDTSVTWREYSKVIENQYSTTNENKLCAQREESASNDNKTRRLIIMNNFTAMAVTRAARDAAQQVRYETVKRLVTRCQKEGFAAGRIFNGYSADRIIDACNVLYDREQKTVFEYVNELNEEALVIDETEVL